MIEQVLGPYRVLEKLGEGGMGEVYRATDTKLGRQVAIKVLPASLAHDPERLARFDREARTLAALNHPHIAQIYGVEESGATRALIMELVEGETLADRIARGPVPVDEALAIGRQIAEALAAAHDLGIVHRDLKPANVRVTEAGVVKVLDFGLAKALEPAAAGAGMVTMSPTITSPAMTQAGIILGTAAYMAPEQARGRPVDKRADIWAFGVVLYELVTGTRPFSGDNITDTLAGVVKEQPDFSKVPVRLRRLITRCLEKDPAKRLRDVGDAWDLLDDDPVVAVTPGGSPGRALPWAVALAATAAAAIVAGVHFREPAPARATVVRFQIPAVMSGPATNPSISPDGTRIVYNDGSGLVVRVLDSLEVRPLAGTGGLVTAVFWSPNSRSIVVGFPDALRIFPAEGGQSRHFAALNGILDGGFWTADDRVVFSTANGVYAVAGAGGMPVLLGTPEPRRRILSGAPMLPGNRFLYTVPTGAEAEQGVYVGSLAGEAARRVLPDVTGAAYVPAPRGGHLVFVRDGNLLAQRMDERSLELSGELVTLAPARAFTASPSGALVYATAAGPRSLTWFDRRGQAIGTVAAPSTYAELALAPEGSRLAVVRTGVSAPATWIHDFARESSAQLSGLASVKPTWMPDGVHVLVASGQRDGRFSIYRRATTTPGIDESVVRSDTFVWPWDVSMDGAWLLYARLDPRTGEDLWLLPLSAWRAGDDQSARGEPFLVTDYTETNGTISPDGRSVAYVSNEGGAFEVFVRALPAVSGSKQQVSNGGGYQPRWRPDGRELFYFTGDGRLMSVDVAPGARPAFGSPKLLFRAPIFGGGGTAGNWYWDVAPDGQRFLINTIAAGSDNEATVLLNWQSEMP